MASTEVFEAVWAVVLLAVAMFASHLLFRVGYECVGNVFEATGHPLQSSVRFFRHTVFDIVVAVRKTDGLE